MNKGNISKIMAFPDTLIRAKCIKPKLIRKLKYFKSNPLSSIISCRIERLESLTCGQ